MPIHFLPLTVLGRSLATGSNNGVSGVSLECGTTISSANYASLYACELLCYQSQTVCDGVNYNTANHVCYLLTGSLTSTSGASYRTAMRFTTNPCTVTETSISTGVSTETSTVTILDTSSTQTSCASVVPSATSLSQYPILPPQCLAIGPPRWEPLLPHRHPPQH